ncbi:hypothetical protein WJX73_010551 [Symbiochloris irregularis]|uniref:MRN complex-interacting protein N-terminal domain-containing protein n=1 Tax=Symbiochloris irregularis TaxID=706552 RepID=A0AAW1PJA0_9CHLO
MPQYQAVRCYSCETFQVQQIKKVDKFNCSLCGEKQSVKLVYATNPKASEVRAVVRQLNSERGKVAEERQAPAAHIVFSSEPQLMDITDKWQDFLEAPSQPVEQVDDQDDCSGFVTSLPEGQTKRRRVQSQERSRNTKQETARSVQPAKHQAVAGWASERQTERVQRTFPWAGPAASAPPDTSIGQKMPPRYDMSRNM